MKDNFLQEWFETTYRNIGDFLGGGTPSTKEADFWNGNIDWTTSRRINDSIYISNGEKKITKSGLNHSSTNLVPRGNLLIATRVGVGKVAINTVDMAISQDLTGLIVNKEKYSPEFIAYQTRSWRIQEAFRRQKRGATIKGISREDLKDFILYIPLLAEQQKIAAVLLKIQQAIETQESIIEAAQELKKSTMQHVFTYGLRGEKTKETEIGRVPESWSLKPAIEVFTLTSGKTRPENIADRKNHETKYPVYGGNGVMGYSTKFFLSSKALVLGRVGEYCGVVHISHDKSWITDNALYSKEWLDSGISIDYIALYLTFFDLNKLKRRSSQPLISQSIVYQQKMPIPDNQEQQKIVNILKSIDNKIELHSAKKSTLQDLFKTMLNKLMTGEIRVKALDIDMADIKH